MHQTAWKGLRTHISPMSHIAIGHFLLRHPVLENTLRAKSCVAPVSGGPRPTCLVRTFCAMYVSNGIDVQYSQTKSEENVIFYKSFSAGDRLVCFGIWFVLCPNLWELNLTCFVFKLRDLGLYDLLCPPLSSNFKYSMHRPVLLLVAS